MISDLAFGRTASSIFAEIMNSENSLSPSEVTKLVAAEFPKIDSAAIQFMRRWRGFGHRDSIQDNVLDMAVRQFLVEAGYDVAPTRIQSER